MQNHSSDSVAFSELASAFCDWCESESLPERPEVAASVWLARLHAAAFALPEIACDNDEALPDLVQSLLARAEKNLSYFSGMYYRTVFHPNPVISEEPVIGDIGDDLLDTYKDIKAGVILAERGQLQEALWHWQFLHRIHWGKHAVGALGALQAFSREPAA